MLKRVLAVVLSILLVCTGTAVFALDDTNENNPSPTYELGDTNTDGKVNVRDATAIQKHIAEISILDEAGLALADVNCDDLVNVRDATYIQKIVAGLIEPTTPLETQATDPTESTASETEATEPTETTVPETEATDPTETTTPETQATDPTKTTAPETKPSETTQPATRDPNKPIELPFVPI